jgi:DNA-binding transcriptional LysR family regulator
MVIGRLQRRHPNFAGIQAAVSAGLGVSILPDVAILADHQILRVKDGFSVGDTELALVAPPDASPATRRLADLLAEFCAPSVRKR